MDAQAQKFDSASYFYKLASEAAPRDIYVWQVGDALSTSCPASGLEHEVMFMSRLLTMIMLDHSPWCPACGLFRHSFRFYLACGPSGMQPEWQWFPVAGLGGNGIPTGQLRSGAGAAAGGGVGGQRQQKRRLRLAGDDGPSAMRCELYSSCQRITHVGSSFTGWSWRVIYLCLCCS